jgi:hypothetical protein
VLSVLKGIDTEHEAAVHQAAGLPYPIPHEIERLVKLYDIKMFVTEWRDLMRNIEHPSWKDYQDVEPLPETIKPWKWNLAFEQLAKRMRRLLPALRVGSAP